MGISLASETKKLPSILSHPWHLAGFGLCQAWVYIMANNPTVVELMSSQSNNLPSLGVLNPTFVFISSALIMLLGALGFPVRTKTFLAFSCILAGIGTPVMALAAPLNYALTVIAVFACDFGTMVLMYAWGSLWCTLHARRYAVHLIASNIVACAIVIIAGFLPFYCTIAIAAFLPAASMAILFASAGEAEAKKSPANEDIAYPSPFRVFITVMVIAAAYLFTRSFFFQSFAQTGSPQLEIMAVYGGLALVVALWCAIGHSGPLIGRIYRASITIMLVGFITLLALGDKAEYISQGAEALGYSFISGLIWIMHPHLLITVNKKEIDLFGWNVVVLHGCAFLGMVLGYLFFSRISIDPDIRNVACLILVALVVIMAINIMTEQDFMQFVNPLRIENVTMPPHSAMVPDAMFAQECLLFAEKNGLSQRETDVFTLLAQGRNIPYIVKELCISDSTARTHTRNIYRKLDIHSRQELLDMLQQDWKQRNSM